MRKRLLIMIVLTFAFGMAVNMLLLRYVGELSERKGPTPEPRVSQVFSGAEHARPAARNRPAGRVPDDPSRLGIVVISRMDKPTGAVQWDGFLKKVFEESGALKSKEGQAVVRRMQLRPGQYKAVIKRLDEEISKAEVAAYRNEMDDSLQRRLEILYQMKALSRVLEKNGIVNPGAAALPMFE